MPPNQLASSMRVVIEIFGEGMGKALALAAGNGKQLNWRGVLEPTSAGTQCAKTGHAFVAGMECYLCGLEIPDKETLQGPSDEAYPECEHLLPVTEARWYLDLYMSNRQVEGEWIENAIRLEYEQSHRVCNQAKSNLSFVELDKSDKLIVSTGGITRILQAIKGRAGRDTTNSDLIKQIHSTILKRADAIRARVQLIIDHINSAPQNDDLSANLLTLARTSAMRDTSTFTGPVLAAYNEWDAQLKTTGPQNQRVQELITVFLEETYLSSPQFLPEKLGPLVYERPDMTVPPELRYKPEEIKSRVQDILVEYFMHSSTSGTDPKSFDKYKKLMTAAVFYGMRIDILNKIDSMDKNNKENYQALFCKMFNDVQNILDAEPDIKKIVGDIPAISEEVKRKCTGYENDQARKNRAALRQSLDMNEPSPIPEEEAVYYLDGLENLITRKLTGITNIDSAAVAKKIYNAATETFLSSFSQGSEMAIESAASISDSMIRETLQAYPTFAEKIGIRVFSYIVNKRIKEKPSDTVPPVASSSPRSILDLSDDLERTKDEEKSLEQDTNEMDVEPTAAAPATAPATDEMDVDSSAIPASDEMDDEVAGVLASLKTPPAPAPAPAPKAKKVTPKNATTEKAGPKNATRKKATRKKAGPKKTGAAMDVDDGVTGGAEDLTDKEGSSSNKGGMVERRRLYG